MSGAPSSLFDPLPPAETVEELRARNIEAREEGVRLVDAATTEFWKSNALAAVEHVARMAADGFTAEDVWARLDWLRQRDGANPAALGPVLRRARSQGLIVPTGVVRPRRLDPKHPALPVWRAAP